MASHGFTPEKAGLAGPAVAETGIVARHGWHKAEIKAALEKRGLSLAILDRRHGFPTHTCSAALFQPYRQAEAAIAEAVGVAPHLLWPERYHPDGTRISPQPYKKYRRAPKPSPGQKHEAA